MRTLLIITQKIDRNDPVLGFFHEWVHAFSGYFDLIEVICLERGAYQLPDTVRVHSLGKESGAGRLRRVLRFYALVWKLRKKYASVLVHMNPEYVVLAGIFWRFYRKRIVLWYVHRSVTMYVRIATALGNAICTASKKSFRLQSSKVRIVGHGIDTEQFSPSSGPSAERIIITSIGRLSPTKSYETLLEACARLDSSINYQLHIVGGPTDEKDMHYEKELKELSSKLHLSDRVIFDGPVPHTNVVAYLQKSDIFVNLSGTGSIDKAVLEAMACGVPVVTSNEAFAEVFNASYTKKFLIVKKSASTVSQAIGAMCALSNEQRKAFGLILRAIIVERYSLPELIKKVSAILMNPDANRGN